MLEKRNHFTPEERNILSVAFKNLVTSKRTTWRTINAVEQSQRGNNNNRRNSKSTTSQSNGNDPNNIRASTKTAINSYKAVIEERLHANCQSICNLLMQNVIPRVEKRCRDNNVAAVEERAFFYKMVGDYCRYASESVSSEASRRRATGLKEQALHTYKKSLEISTAPKGGLPPYNSVRLGLALNFSVFYYEIMGDARSACQVAKAALQAAMEVIDDCSEDVF